MAKPLKEKIEEAMWSSDVSTATHCILRPLSFLYGIGVRARLLLFKIGFLRAKKLPCPVISVGNITVGGSGKTPVVAALSQMLTAKGRSVVILSRGYKRHSTGTEVVSDKNSVLLDAKQAGDEPYLLAIKCKGVPVIVGTDRFTSGLLAIERFSPDIMILDDAFSHIKLKRELDLLLFDSVRGVGRGHMLPRGPLREPKSSIDRADVIMIKGKGDLQKQYRFKQQVWTFTYSPTSLISLTGETTEDIKLIKGKKIFAFSGLADPESFHRTLNDCGANIISKLSFPDHHWFSSSDLSEIKKRSEGADFIVTTEKDLVRLDAKEFSGHRVFALAIEAKITNAKSLLKLIESKLQDSKGR